MAESLRREGIDVLLCLDVSSSMLADDMEAGRPRLELALAAAARFLDARPEDRVGLLTFARYPDLLCPPTLDHRALRRILAEVRPVEEDGPEDATGIGLAAARAAEVLARSPARSKVAILLTDGEENVAVQGAADEIPPVAAAQLAARLGVRVHAVLAGTGRPGPGGAGVPLATRDLEPFAARTGGRVFAAPDAAAMARVYEEIDALERTGFVVTRLRLEDRFLPFLLLALFLLVLARGLRASLLGALP